MINFKTEMKPKIKFLDFGAFQKITKILLLDENIFHVLFGAFHGTPVLTFSAFSHNGSRLMNPDISWALYTLRIQYSYSRTQCEDGARDVRVL